MSRRKQARPSRLLDDEDEAEGEGGEIATNNKTALTDKEDANNNESKEKESEDEEEEDEDELKRENEKTMVIQSLLQNLSWPAGSPSVTLEALNTKVAVAQMAANALANNNGENAQDLGILQSTLFTLQQQQLLQLQLIQQLQQQLHVSNSNSDEDELSSSSPPPPPQPSQPHLPPQPLPPSSTPLAATPGLGGGGRPSSMVSTPGSGSGGGGSGGPQVKPENAEHEKIMHHRSGGGGNSGNRSGGGSNGRSNKKPRSKENNVITEDEIIDEEEEGGEGRTKSNAATTMSTSGGGGNNGLRNNNNSDGGTGAGGLNPAFASLLNCSNLDPNRPLSPGLQSHQINNNHLTQTDVPNTLEMLQKRTQEVLDSASQGLLQSSLAADDPRKKLGPYEKGREPFFKHRCRYCGKVFGSDSALQIHIRSHTGERPFKCNVCGSRFTTKGNLKVHFQRHTSKFPGVRMNPNPIPEHLDHFHPPLLEKNSNPTTPEHSPNPQSGSLPQQNPFMHHHAPFFGSLFRFDVKPPPPSSASLPFFNNNGNSSNAKDAPLSPQDLTKPKNTRTEVKKEKMHHETEDDGEVEDDEDDRDGDEEDGRRKILDNSPKLVQEDDEPREERRKQKGSKDDIDRKSGGSGSGSIRGNADDEDDDEDERENDDEQPENLSSKSLPLMYPLPLVARPSRPSSSSASTPTTTTNRSAEHSPTPIRFHSHNFHHLQQVQAQAQAQEQHQQHLQQQRQLEHHHQMSQKMLFDPAKDPAIYTNLLPRPGSNDNAWESLIEVSKTSETSKLQQLVDNIEHKLTDPNQCCICLRILSCKSALQMHYRTHTGERPFKCKICGRAFTTKGNLKTHMGVHRAKPPLRVLHQCPVCHKRFTNSLVLQQHIRLHTGEPTDLTPDQIRAAEVKDSYPPFGNPLFGAFRTMTEVEEEMMMMNDGMNDESNDETNESIDSESIISNKPTTSLAALENQVRTITTTASNFAANLSSPKLNSSGGSSNHHPHHPRHDHDDSSCSSGGGSRSVSPRSSSQPHPQPPSMALDLTPPRNSGGQIFNPFHHLPPPPLGFPASLLTPTTTANAVAALANLSSFSPGLVPPPRLTESESFLWTAAAQQARGNTTCHICLKTFACNSALEIHYRSHTKERPFKCNICDRGFSTKGNMKQHMLTHKTVRDMPASSNSSFESANKQNGLGGQSDDSNKSPPESPKSQSQHGPHSCPHMNLNNHNNSNTSNNSSNATTTNNSKRPASPPTSPPQPTKKMNDGLPSSSSSTSNIEDKHLCKICDKNFSSSSALHIHLRVHSGERPFQCQVCQKAFTTKGNLKVHMGTHLWNPSSQSRRGRRMSLDPMTVFLPHPHHPHHLPPHPQIPHPILGTTTIKDLHHPTAHRPTELFFPFSNNTPSSQPQNIFQHNGSLKSFNSKASPEGEDEDSQSHDDDEEDIEAESSKENGQVLEKGVDREGEREEEEELVTGSKLGVGSGEKNGGGEEKVGGGDGVIVGDIVGIGSDVVACIKEKKQKQEA